MKTYNIWIYIRTRCNIHDIVFVHLTSSTGCALYKLTARDDDHCCWFLFEIIIDFVRKNALEILIHVIKDISILFVYKR